jgi:hypothetical protein
MTNQPVGHCARSADLVNTRLSFSIAALLADALKPFFKVAYGHEKPTLK